MSAYYNENDPGAAAWLRELIKAGEIAPGDVDERSIEDVRPGDLDGYAQCHFFAGIGGWSHALRLADWPDDRPVWTGSCPCQPFSQAGRGLGAADKRHLWPAWHGLIRERHPPTIFGEQVASKAAMHWLAAVQNDLEGGRYAFAAFDLPAASVGAPHIRQRLYFVADCNDSRLEVIGEQPARKELSAAERSGAAGRTADTDGRDASSEREQRSGEQRLITTNGMAVGHLANSPFERRRQGGSHVGGGTAGDRAQRLAAGPVPGRHVDGFWSAADWIYCRDEKYRPVEPGTFPLADGSPARVGRLRGYGNAIVAPLAAEFIKAYMSI